jgi:hypothetical protein
MRAQPDQVAYGPSGAPRPQGRHRAAVTVGLAALVLGVLLVAGLVHWLVGRSGTGPEAATTPQTSTPLASPTPSATPYLNGDPDDAGVPSKESAKAAASFVDAWLTKDRTRRLERLKSLTVTSLYEGLTFTDVAEIPAARRVGGPRVEDAGSYLVRYRVTLSDRSEVLVSTVYDGSRWLVESVEPGDG